MLPYWLTGTQLTGNENLGNQCQSFNVEKIFRDKEKRTWEYLFIGLYYRQHSVDIQIKIKTSFVRSEGPMNRDIKTCINFIIFILIFVENCL